MKNLIVSFIIVVILSIVNTTACERWCENPGLCGWDAETGGYGGTAYQQVGGAAMPAQCIDRKGASCSNYDCCDLECIDVGPGEIIAGPRCGGCFGPGESCINGNECCGGACKHPDNPAADCDIPGSNCTCDGCLLGSHTQQCWPNGDGCCNIDSDCCNADLKCTDNKCTQTWWWY